eukprot:5371776-Prymnesium_polylepis.1
MFPDLWALVLWGGINALAIPVVVPVAIYQFSGYVLTYVACTVALLLFTAAVRIYLAAQVRYGGGMAAAMRFETDAPPPGVDDAHDATGLGTVRESEEYAEDVEENEDGEGADGRDPADGSGVDLHSAPRDMNALI